jgi:outer membrane lipoprotein
MVPLFLEPMRYSSERLVTVNGTVAGSETRKVGEYPYRYPLIAVDTQHLWPVEPEPADLDHYPWWWHDPWYYDPLYYDPWYYPRYPFYPYPRLHRY